MMSVGPKDTDMRQSIFVTAMKDKKGSPTPAYTTISNFKTSVQSVKTVDGAVHPTTIYKAPSGNGCG